MLFFCVHSIRTAPSVAFTPTTTIANGSNGLGDNSLWHRTNIGFVCYNDNNSGKRYPFLSKEKRNDNDFTSTANIQNERIQLGIGGSSNSSINSATTAIILEQQQNQNKEVCKNKVKNTNRNREAHNKNSEYGPTQPMKNRRDYISTGFINLSTIFLGIQSSETMLSSLSTPTIHRVLAAHAADVPTDTQTTPSTTSIPPIIEKSRQTPNGGKLLQMTDPDTYSSIVYFPPPITTTKQQSSPPSFTTSSVQQLPVLFVVHGAGKNEGNDPWILTDPKGEHRGLQPSLLATGRGGNVPKALYENFIVIAPYVGKDKRSFYEEPRYKLLNFLTYICNTINNSSNNELLYNNYKIDTNSIYLFGFSDGATLGIELATTKRFRGCVIAAYGYTGILPKLAIEKLMGIPIWVFHSVDDVIFPVRCSDQLVETLQKANNNNGNIIKYTRYEYDQEGFTGSVRGHSTGITAAKLDDIYTWMLSIPIETKK